MGQRTRILTLLWMLALLVGVANALVVVRRLPIQRQLAADADERAVQDAVRWIAPLPSDARLLLLVSSADPTNFHFGTRLIYFLYPRHITIASDALPLAAERYDAVLAFGSAKALLNAHAAANAAHWQIIQQDERASLAASAALASAAKISESDQSLLPLPLRALSGIFGLLAIVALGALLLCLTLRAPPFAHWWANLAVAHLIGATALAILQSLCILLAGKTLVWPVYALIAALSCFAGRRLWHWNLLSKHASLSEGQLAAGLANRHFICRFQHWFCLAAIALGLVTVLERAWLIDLDWDALAIWQLKSKALFLDGNVSLWRDTIQFPYTHFDYPLLVPLLTWWTYRQAGAIDLHWAQVTGFLFYADMLTLFAAFALRRVAVPYMLLGVGLLCGLPEVTLHAVSGYADLPLAAYFLGAGAFLSRVLVERETDAWPLVGWMLAGVVLVKNEGMLACVSLFIVTVVYTIYAWRGPPRNIDAAQITTQAVTASEISSLPARPPVQWPQLPRPPVQWPQLPRPPVQWPQLPRLTAQWLLCASVAYLPWWLLKQRLALTNDVMQPAHPPHLSPPLLWWRLWYAIGNGFLKQMAWLGPRFPAWGLFGLLVVVGLAVSWKRDIKEVRPLWLLCCVQLCGYVGIYMITPSALPAHVVSSVDRLVLHVAPLLLLAALTTCFAEERIQEKGERRKGKVTGAD